MSQQQLKDGMRVVIQTDDGPQIGTLEILASQYCVLNDDESQGWWTFNKNNIKPLETNDD